MGKTRESNIELCRIFAIVGVLIVHSVYGSLGWPKVAEDTTIPLILAESFAIIGVNVFVLITGYFSVKFKISAIVNIIYACLFYAILKLIIGYLTNDISFKNILFITNSNWFIPTYLMLLFISPCLNHIVQSVNKYKLGGVICILLFLEIYGDFLRNYTYFGFNHGYSIVSFVTLYFVGRYYKLYGLTKWFEKFSPIIYVVCSLIVSAISYAVIRLNYKIDTFTDHLYWYSNPFIIIGALSFFVMFTKLRMPYVPFINFIAKSVFGMLLLHCGTPFFNWFSSHFRHVYAMYDSYMLLLIWIISLLSFMMVAVVVDQVRLVTYDKFIRRIIEKINIKIK